MQTLYSLPGRGTEGQVSVRMETGIWLLAWILTVQPINLLLVKLHQDVDQRGGGGFDPLSRLEKRVSNTMT